MMEALFRIPKNITLSIDKLNHVYLNVQADAHDVDSDEKFSYGKIVNKCIDFQRKMPYEIRFEAAEAYKGKIRELREGKNQR